MMQIPPKKLSEIRDNAEAYLSNRLDYFRLKAVEKTAKIMADLLSSLLFIVIMSLAFLLTTITIAFYLSEYFESYQTGFGCVAAFFVAGALLILLAKDNLENKISDISIKRYFDRHCDDHEDSGDQVKETKPCED